MRTRGLGALLLGTWVWWALGWAVDLAGVSPIHWPSLFPRLLIEGIPATVGALTAGLMVLGSNQTHRLAWLFAATAAHSAIVAAAMPDLTARHGETLRQSRRVWDQTAPGTAAAPEDLEPGRTGGRFLIDPDRGWDHLSTPGIPDVE